MPTTVHMASNYRSLVGYPADPLSQRAYVSAEQQEAGMGRFYFHLRSDETLIADEEGSECLDIAAARLEALAGARCILVDAIRSGAKTIPDAFVIADAEGHELEAVPLKLALPEQWRK